VGQVTCVHKRTIYAAWTFVSNIVPLPPVDIGLGILFISYLFFKLILAKH